MMTIAMIMRIMTRMMRMMRIMRIMVMETKDVTARLAAEVPKGVDDNNDETDDDSGLNG